jgi:hypothetical protein
MQRHLILAVLFLCLGCSFCWADNNELSLIKSINVSNGYFTTDPIGNIYLVKDENFLVKYNARGDSLAVFNDVGFGSITSIDATNPLRVLVFYADFGRIKILDNMLSLKNELDLTRLGLFNVPAVANSQDGTIWVYDPAGRLLKIDDRLEIKHSYLLRNMLDYSVSPSHLVERERILYMTDTAQGILQFDRFGFYRTVYRFSAAESNVLNGYIVYYHQGSLHSYHTKSLRSATVQLPNPEDILNARLEKNLIFILRNEKLDIYTFRQK